MTKLNLLIARNNLKSTSNSPCTYFSNYTFTSNSSSTFSPNYTDFFLATAVLFFTYTFLLDTFLFIKHINVRQDWRNNYWFTNEHFSDKNRKLIIKMKIKLCPFTFCFWVGSLPHFPNPHLEWSIQSVFSMVIVTETIYYQMLKYGDNLRIILSF